MVIDRPGEDPVVTAGAVVSVAVWELNRLLQRWLGYSLRQGHCFLAAVASPCPAEPSVS